MEDKIGKLPKFASARQGGSEAQRRKYKVLSKARRVCIVLILVNLSKYVSSVCILIRILDERFDQISVFIGMLLCNIVFPSGAETQCWKYEAMRKSSEACIEAAGLGRL